MDKIIDFPPKDKKTNPPTSVETVSYSQSLADLHGYDDVILVGITDNDDVEDFTVDVISNIDDAVALIGTLGIAITHIAAEGLTNGEMGTD